MQQSSQLTLIQRKKKVLLVFDVNKKKEWESELVLSY